MERHFSTGVATIVALMAAQQAASEQEEAKANYFRGIVGEDEAELRCCGKPGMGDTAQS
ncbi:hypothetical protein [Rhodopila sp.]|uniref:hypothetical protein n=1 Tax=Rhodopila sp. TaxID=2480087 RepID=UPI003D0DBA93